MDPSLMMAFPSLFGGAGFPAISDMGGFGGGMPSAGEAFATPPQFPPVQPLDATTPAVPAPVPAPSPALPSPMALPSMAPMSAGMAGYSRGSQDVAGSGPMSYGPDVAANQAPPADPIAAASGGAKPSDLAAILRGVQAPQAPVPQKVNTPQRPHPSTQIHDGTKEILAMLQMMGRPGGQPAIPYPINMGRV